MSGEAKKLRRACRKELDHLWYDLADAVNTSVNGRWSIKCDGLVGRIKRLTRLVGPTPWETVRIPLIESGVYQRLHAELGIEVSPDMARIAVVRASIDRRNGRG